MMSRWEINHFMADLKNLNYPVLQIENNHSFQGVIKNIDKLHKLQAPHYDVPTREHHFAEIWKYRVERRQMVGPVYEAETKDNYQGPEPHQEDLSSEVGPVYRVERRHSFQKGFSCEIDKKTVKGPVYAVEHRHQYEQGFSCKERPPSPTPGPVRGGDRQGRHNYKHPITLKRGNRSKSVGFEVNSSEDFKEKETRSDDRRELVGPIYSTGKIADERVHHFTQGYQAPMSAEQKAEKMRLIKKHFEKQQKAIGSLHKKVVSKVTSLQQQTEVRSHSESRVSRDEALRLGENRRQEAVQRRQQFLQQERESRKTMSQRERMASQQERFLVQQEEQKLEEGGGQRQVCQAWQQSGSQQQTWAETQQTTQQQQQISQTLLQQQGRTQSQQTSQMG